MASAITSSSPEKGRKEATGEGLLVHDSRLQRHVRQHRGLEEVALIADAPTAGLQLGALLHRVIDEALKRRDSPIIRQRSHLGALVQAASTFTAFAASVKASTTSL